MNGYYQRSSSSSNVGQMPQPIQTKLSTGSDVPRAVHSLLSSTKRLQDVLKLWSMDKATEVDVSDLYVQIGNEFNATIGAFSDHNIDLSDLHDIPTELRTVLEQCLAVDPSPEVLEGFLPDLRRVLYRLLKGLQDRQAQWEAVSRRFDVSRLSSDSL